MRLTKAAVAQNKAARYRERLRELEFDDGVYLYRYHIRHGHGTVSRGFQVRIRTFADEGYSCWFGDNAYGSPKEAKKAAYLYREFAIQQLPNPFPTKDQFIKWLMRRSKR